MKIVGSIVTALALVAIALIPTSAHQRKRVHHGRVNLSVSSIRLGSSYSDIRMHLGRPTSDTSHRDDSMGSIETVRTLKYPGLAVTLHKSRRVFLVVSVEVTSSDWLVAPGIRVGLSAKQVVAKLGAPIEESNEGGRHRYHYLNAGGDGYALLEFENDKLVALGWSYDLS